MRVVRRYLQSDRAPVAAVWLLVIAVAALIYWHLRNQPFFWDAKGYVDAARDISDHGLLSKWANSDRRSYGYPLFLVGALKVARGLHVGPTTGIFLAQWPIFVGTTWLVARSLFSSRRTRLIAFAAVAADPLLVVYAPQAFTESLTLSCILFATAALGRAARMTPGRASAAWLTAGAAVCSYAVVIRPGSVLVPCCYGLAAAALLAWQRRRGQWVGIGAVAALMVVAFVAPLIPQMVINHLHYGSSSPLPTYDLAGLQAQYGLLLARYSTNVSTCGKPRLEFPNPHRVTTSADTTTLDALRYYTLTWPDGPELLVLHVFSGFDPRPFLIDQRDFGTWYERVFQAFTVALLFLAGAGLIRAVRRLRALDPRLRIDSLFLGAVTVIFLGVLATSAAEYRFGSVPLVTISLLAALWVGQRWRPSGRVVALSLIGYCGVLLVWITFSDLLLSTSPIWQQCS